MKRLTALALALILLLSLAACVSVESGPALQDKLGTTPTTSKDPAEAETTVKPEPESQPGSASGKQPSGGNKNNEPTEGAPVRDDYSKYAGIYVRDTSGDEDPTVLEIHVYSDILLLEYSYLSDGVLSGTWVEEFWPDPDIFEDGEPEHVSGAYQGFNIIEGTCDYWSEATPCTIVLTKEGVLVQEKGYEYQYRRDESLPSVHTSFDSQMARLCDRGSGQPAAELAGEWEYNDPYSAGYLHMGSDGSFAFVWKDRHRPAEVWTGAWVPGSDTDQITVCAARIGDMKETYELQLGYFQEDSCRFLSYGGEEVNTVLTGGIFLWPGDGQWSTDFTLEQLTSVYYESMHVSGTATVSDGFEDYEMNYSYRIPCFFSEGSTALDQINSDICDRFETLAETELDRLSRNEAPATYMIEYDYVAFDGVEQLILWTDSYYEVPDRAVYCYDRERDMQLDTKALLKRLGISESDFLAAVRAAAEEYFHADNDFMTEEQRQEMGYDAKLAWTISDEAVNLDMPVVLTSYGELTVIARIGGFAGLDYYYATLYPFSDAVG